MSPYSPHLTQPGGFTPADRELIQRNISIHNLTHVRTKTGEVLGIRLPLNEKSIPLNDASTTKTRVNYPSVESFGIIDPNPYANHFLERTVKKMADQGITVSVDLAPGIERNGTTVGEHIKKAVEDVQRNADGNPIDTQGRTYGEHVQHLSDTRPTERPLDPWKPAPLPEAVEGAGEQETPADNTIKHEVRAHAILSASGAHRWLNCTPSARLEEHHPDSTSDAAAQGTAAHELAEHKLRTLMGIESTRPESHWHDEEMEDHTDHYADHCIAELVRTQENSPAAFLSIEERLNFSHLVPDGFGTGDTVIVGDGTMTIVDLKYGKGVEVSAVKNPQMMLYALGALNTYGMIYQIDQVRMVIYQPRRNNISVWETTVAELLNWAEEVVKPKAQEAYAGEGQLQAGDWCQFCRHAPQCTALAAQHFESIPTAPAAQLTPEAPDPATLSEHQISQIVQHAGDIKKWLTTVEKHALDKATTGTTYPGLKLVAGRSVRRYTDTEAVAETVLEAGRDPWKPRELIGITDMTKLLGKKNFDTLIGPLLDKPEGKPTLVPENDKRPTLTVATPETVFTAIN